VKERAARRFTFLAGSAGPCARIVGLRLIGVAYQVVGDQRGTESGRELLVGGLDLGEVQQFDQLVTTRLSFLWLPSKCTGRVCRDHWWGDAP